MPTYEYACKTCGKEFEVFQSIKAEPLTTCNCGKNGQVQRKIGRGAGIIFKGTGFYETDYKRKGDSGSSSSSSSSSSGSSAGSSSSGPSSSSSSAPSSPSAPAAPSAPPPPAST